MLEQDEIRQNNRSDGWTRVIRVSVPSANDGSLDTFSLRVKEQKKQSSFYSLRNKFSKE